MELENIKTLKVKYTRNGEQHEQFIEDEGNQWWIDFADKWSDVTSLEFVEDLTELKKAKILKASQECNARILAGFESSCLGQPKTFDCEEHDQRKIIGMAFTAKLVLDGVSTRKLSWKGKGELECYEFTPAQVLQLADDMYKHIEDNTEQFNAERVMINAE